MDAERWKQVDRLLEAALARPPHQRDAFLHLTCVDDDALEREIRSLLQSPNWGLYYSISHLGLARASALVGDAANARTAFQDFFAVWKDADTDIAILHQAKAEYARLP